MPVFPEIRLTREQKEELASWIAEGCDDSEFIRLLDRLGVPEYLLRLSKQEDIIYKYLVDNRIPSVNAEVLKIAVDELEIFDNSTVTEILIQNNNKIDHIFLDNYVNHPDKLKDPVEEEYFKSYIEKHAPKITCFHMDSALDHLRRGKDGDCLGCCRKALESLTKDHSLNDALDELVKNRLILDKKNNFALDKPLINGVYKFCSSYGSHELYGIPQPSPEQAIFGYSMTQSVLYLLIKLLVKQKSSVKFNRWKSPRN